MISVSLYRVYARSVRLFCVLIVTLALSAGGQQATRAEIPAAAQDGCGIGLLFVGLTHANLTYDASGCGHPIDTTVSRVRIDINWTEGSGVAMEFTAALNGEFDAGIPETLQEGGGVIAYSLTLELQPGNQIYSTSVYQAVETGLIAGILQQDETITPKTGGVRVGYVLVPAGRKLILKDGVYNGGSDGRIEVRGLLVPAAGVRLEVGVDLFTPHAFSAPSGWWEIVFRPGSGGSTVAGSGAGNKFYVLTDSDVPLQFSDLKEDQVYIDNGAVQFTRGNVSILSLNGGRSFTADSTAYLSVQMQPGQVYSGKMTIAHGESAWLSFMLGSGADVTLNEMRGDAVEEGISLSADVPSGAKLLLDNSTTVYGAEVTLRLTGDPPGQAVVRNSNLRYGVTVAGGAAEITNNQIADGVTLLGKSATKITGNAFLRGGIRFSQAEGWPSWESTEGDDPKIEGNSFLGRQALEATFALVRTIATGANSFGDMGGPRLIYQDGTPSEMRFLGPRGATVQLTSGDPSGPRGFTWGNLYNTGPAWTDSDVFPEIWLQGARIGQNILGDSSHDAYLGKETLLSLDIVASQAIPNAQVRVEYDGVDYYPTPVTLYRDLRRAGPDRVAEARTTVNFILPAVADPGPEGLGLRLDVFLDISSISGQVWRPQGVTEIHLLGMDFKHSRGNVARPYRVGVVPVDLFGSCSGKGDAQLVRAELEGRLPDMFRLRPQDIQVTLLPRQTIFCRWQAALSTTFLMNDTVMQLLATERLGNLVGVGPAQLPYDHIVAAMPINSLSGGIEGAIDGGNLPWARRYILVDTGKPSAVVHELGHAIGLWRAPEQYDQYPDNGLPLEGVTAFAVEDWVPLPGDKGRIAHFPRADDWWYQPPDYHDVMGATDLNWPVAETIGSFNSYFGGLRDGSSAALAADEQGWVYLSGALLADPARSGYYLLDPATIRLMDVTGHVVDSSDDPYAGQPITWYRLEYFDADDQLVSYNVFGVYAHGADGRLLDAYSGWRPLNGDRTKAVRLQLRREDTNEIVYTRRPAESLATPILAPAAGGPLTATLTIRWASGTQPLSRYVSFSDDNGATWRFGAWVEGDILTLPTEFLPSGAPLLLRTWTSDGFFNAEERVGGLTIANRSPTVQITSPATGAEALPDAFWSLTARALDVEEGVIRQAVWRSSQDGLLGSRVTLDDVTLSPGDHTLTVIVTDSDGGTASATVQVHVGPVSQADLALPADALQLQPAGHNPTSALPVAITAGVTHTVYLRVLGAGAPLSATVALTMTPPGAPSQLLQRAILPLEIFDWGTLAITFVPVVTGDYRFEAAIEAATLPDPNPANNRQVWVFSDTGTAPLRGLFMPAIQR